jgi:hypothetical protein
MEIGVPNFTAHVSESAKRHQHELIVRKRNGCIPTIVGSAMRCEA